MNFEKFWQSQRVRFLCACAVGFSTYYGLLYALTEYAGWWYMASAGIGLVVDYSITFCLQKIVTFENKTTHKLSTQIRGYIKVSLVYYVANVAALYLLVDIGSVPYLLAQAEISLILTLSSFLTEKRVFT